MGVSHDSREMVSPLQGSLPYNLCPVAQRAGLSINVVSLW
jgi:hypothetical protein